MSVIQRYDLPGEHGQYDLELLPVNDGGYVLYTDHLAAVEAAQEETFKADWSEMGQLAATGIWYRQGRIDALASALQRVEELPAYTDIPYESPGEIRKDSLYSKDWLHYLGVIDAIKGY